MIFAKAELSPVLPLPVVKLVAYKVLFQCWRSKPVHLVYWQKHSVTSTWSLSEDVFLYTVHNISWRSIHGFWNKVIMSDFFVSWCRMKCFIGRALFQLHSHWQLRSQDFSSSHLSLNLQQCGLSQVRKDVFLAKYL